MPADVPTAPTSEAAAGPPDPAPVPDPTPPGLLDVLGDASGLLRVVVDDGVATVELHRPDKHNAVSYAMWAGLARLMPVLADDDAVDVVVLRGTPGGPFSAGADIAEFRALRSTPESAARYGEAVAAGEQAVVAFPRLTVALVEGFAIGGGTQLALACDVRVCDPAARFGIPPARLGIVYALPSTARLVETVGAAWARWVLCTGELLDASTALRIGLVHEVVDDPAARALELARTVADRARVSVTAAKMLVDKAARGQRTDDEDTAAWYAASLTGPEYAEGVDAFLGKRAPDFRAARGTA